MNKHEIALTSLLNDIITHDPLCSVIVVGSIARGDYTPNSDMDVTVVSWRFDTLPDEIGWHHTRTYSRTSKGRFDEGIVKGVVCDMAVGTPSNYEGHVMTGPVWRRGPSIILYDPSGIAEWGERCRNQFYQENSELNKKCIEFENQYRRAKADRSFKREFETESEFVQSLDLSSVKISYSSFVEQAKFQKISLPTKGR